LPADPPPLTRSGAPRPGIGIVHLGIGAFFRAFGAVYTAEAMQASGGDWGVAGVSLRSPAQRDRLAPQDFCYHAVELRPDGPRAQVVEVVQDVRVAPEDPGAVLALMAAPGTRIVSLTVTEKGYCHAPATGRLNAAHPDIVHDLAHPEAPRSAPGFIVRALQRRRAAGLRPFTVLSCDNLPGNGALTRGLILDLAGRIDPALAGWIAAEGRFPCTMVDRIVPAVTPEDLAMVARLTGRGDAAPVLHEPFRQWVIEDDFVDGARPDYAAAGAELVADVAPYELMKLRCLNGTHSALAYTGYLAGHETIAATVADPAFDAYLRRLWSEIVPAVAAPPGVDLCGYCDALRDRYANPAIRHRTWQIAMDGSQKLPQRLFGTIADSLAAGREVPALCLAVAAWMRYAGGTDEAGCAIDVQDPLAPRLRALWEGAGDAQGRVAAFLSLREVFPEALAASAPFRRALTAASAALAARGARATVLETTT